MRIMRNMRPSDNVTVMCFFGIQFFISQIHHASSFQTNSRTFAHRLHPKNSSQKNTPSSIFQRRTSTLMISPFSASSASSSELTLPRDVKEAVSKCRAAVQTALENRLSRMDIEMPVGAKFGVEKQSKSKNKKLLNSDTDDVNKPAQLTYENLQTSDRELARLFVEMFQPVGGNAISVVFMDGPSADMAKKKWKSDFSADCNIQCISKSRQGPSGKKKKKKATGFAAKMAAEMDESVGKPFTLTPNCEVAIFVAPGPKDLITIESISNQVGMGTLVILLNARLSSVSKYHTKEAEDLFTNEFEPVFHLGAAPQDAAPGCLMHRAYPDNWLLARKPKIGQPKVISQQTDRFTSEDCQDAYDNMEVGDMEEAVENVLDNVANWFK